MDPEKAIKGEGGSEKQSLNIRRNKASGSSKNRELVSEKLIFTINARYHAYIL